jgi:hypothetical protein
MTSSGLMGPDQGQRGLASLKSDSSSVHTEVQLCIADTGKGMHSAGSIGRRPLRELVLDILDERGVPALPRVIGVVAVARYGKTLPVSRFASLRRDEERAYRKDPSRPAWVVPALSLRGLTAIPRIVTSSSWPPGRRLIGSRTLRANHLRTLIALLAASERAHSGGDTGAARQLEPLIANFAQTLPGASELGPARHYDCIRKAAEIELGYIERLDLEERDAAARRVKRLPELYQLWGQPTVIEGRGVSRKPSK